MSAKCSSSSSLGVCSICKDNLLDTDIHSTTCGHVFHGECIKKWLENSMVCPVCRSNIDIDSLVRIYPGSVNRNEVPIANDLLTEDELKSLTIESFKTQGVVYSQLSLLGIKLNEQTSYIEKLKAKLEDKEQKYNFVEGEKEHLERKLFQLKESNEELQVVTCKMSSENTQLENKLEEIDTTVDIMEVLFEQHKSDRDDAQNVVQNLEDELATIQNACGEMEETISRIELIRYEVAGEGLQDRPLEDFVEDLISQNDNLKASLEEAEKAVGNQTCTILDLEMNVDTLKETLKDIQESYVDQSSESKDMEESLRTMQRLHQDQSEELGALNAERDLYQQDIKDMLERLRSTEENVTTIEKKRRESEMLNQTYQGQLSETLASIEQLKKDKDDAVMMVALKEDVIRTLQESVESTTNVYLERLEKFSSNDTSSVASEVLQKARCPEQKSDILALIDTRFKALSDEIERKDNLLIHLMKEKNDIEDKITVQETISSIELQDQIATMEGKLSTLQQLIREKENSVEEKEMVITHLVSVVNRYAFNDRDEGTPVRQAKRTSELAGEVPFVAAAREQGQREQGQREQGQQKSNKNKNKKLSLQPPNSGKNKKEGTRRMFSLKR